jgi:hypothetical protein
MQWMQQLGSDEQQQYANLSKEVVTAAASAEDLSLKVAAAILESSQLQLQELAAAAAAAAAAASGGSISAGSSSSYIFSEDAAAAIAAAYAEQMAEAVPEPDTPGLYESSGSSAFGQEPGTAWPGSSGSSMPAAADHGFGAGQYSSFSQEFGDTFSTGSPFFGNSSSSNTTGFGWGSQHNSGLPEQADSNSAWQQAYALPIFGDAMDSHTAGYGSQPQWSSQDDSVLFEQSNHSSTWQQASMPSMFGDAAGASAFAAGVSEQARFSVFGSSNINAAAIAGGVVEPDTPITSAGSTAFGVAAINLPSAAPADSAWSQQDRSWVEHPISSSSFHCRKQPGLCSLRQFLAPAAGPQRV